MKDYTREAIIISIACLPFIIAMIIICYYEVKEYKQKKQKA